MSRKYRGRDRWEKEFLDAFRPLCGRYQSWQIWEDFITMVAISIANSVDRRGDIWQKREDEYLRIINRYRKDEQQRFPELLAITTMALEENPCQDFLGGLFMNLDLGSHWHGQFFTPYHVSELMARVTIGDDLESQINRQGYISVNDPCCGAGVMLIAFAAACRERTDVNYQRDVLFAAQDVDPLAAKMCYIQISLLGCPGYAIIGNSLTEPPLGSCLSPQIKNPGNIWYTPLFFRDIWAARWLKESGTRQPVNTIGTKKPAIQAVKDFFTVKKGGGDEMGNKSPV